MKFFLLFLLPALCLADNAYHKPKYYCRPSNSSVYAEVCVPGFTSEDKQVELDIKNVVDDQYCYTATRTECQETTKNVDREICTYTYQSKKETLSAETVQVTYDTKSETMRVTRCAPSGYGKPHSYNDPHAYDNGEHQICREEYQTQEYRTPLVNEKLDVPVDVAVPEPVKVCETRTIELTEVVCNDVEEERCIDLAKFEDGKASVRQTETILGEPDCDQVTLTLPTEVCSKHGYGH